MDKNPDTKTKDKIFRFQIVNTVSKESKSKMFFVKIFKLIFSFRIYRGKQNIQTSFTWVKTGSTPDKGGKLEVWREYQETESSLEAKTFH